jgi:hypothetical protein
MAGQTEGCLLGLVHVVLVTKSSGKQRQDEECKKGEDLSTTTRRNGRSDRHDGNHHDTDNQYCIDDLNRHRILRIAGISFLPWFVILTLLVSTNVS